MEYKEIIARLGKIPTGDLTDSMRRLGISGYTKGIYCLQGKPVPNMVGPALTVKYIEKQPGQKTDFVGGQFAFARMATEGQVIFIDAKGTQCWLTGGNVCRVAELAGAAGLVVDGCLRDLDGIEKLDMPIYAKGITPQGPFKFGPGEINTPIACGGQVVFPGDILVGDPDGIVVIRRQDAEEVAQAAIKKKASEDKTFELMEADLAAYAARHKATTEKRFTSAGGEVPQFGSYTELYKL